MVAKGINSVRIGVSGVSGVLAVLEFIVTEFVNLFGNPQ